MYNLSDLREKCIMLHLNSNVSGRPSALQVLWLSHTWWALTLPIPLAPSSTHNDILSYARHTQQTKLHRVDTTSNNSFASSHTKFIMYFSVLATKLLDQYIMSHFYCDGSKFDFRLSGNKFAQKIAFQLEMDLHKLRRWRLNFSHPARREEKLMKHSSDL